MAFRLRWRSSHWQTGGGCQGKQKRSIDQRALQIGYEGIKNLQSLDIMKNYLRTEELLSLVESYNNGFYLLIFIAGNVHPNPPPVTPVSGPDWEDRGWKDDGFGLGDYPNLPERSYQLRDPYQKYWDQQDRRNFGEPVSI